MWDISWPQMDTKHWREILSLWEIEKLRKYSSVCKDMGLILSFSSITSPHSQKPSLLFLSLLLLRYHLRLSLSVYPLRSRVPSPFSYAWHRLHKSSLSLRTPSALSNLSPCSFFSHPPSAPWDRFHFFHSVCWGAPPPVGVKYLSHTNRGLNMHSVCRLSGMLWLKIETDTFFSGWKLDQFSADRLPTTLEYLPAPTPPPALCWPARVSAF